MATFLLDDPIIEDTVFPDARNTFLPPFPSTKQLRRLFPAMVSCGVPPGPTTFLHYLDFTLEHPDEIWENVGLYDNTYYHYLGFLSDKPQAPAFAVEVTWLDDAIEVKHFSLLVHQEDVDRIRSGYLVYSFLKEWDRERLVRALNDEALEKYDSDRLDDAMRLMNVAIQLSEYKCSYLLNNRGLICWKMGNTERAKSDFLESMKLDDANGDPCFNLGLIFFDEYDFSNAGLFLRRAVELSPSDSQFLTELGHLYLETGKEKEALKLFEKAFAGNPQDPQIDFHLGYYFLYKKRRPEVALKYYGLGLDKDPDDQFALADMAVACWAVGDKHAAVEMQHMLQKQPTLLPYTISRLVYLNAEMGDYQNALELYYRALKQRDPFEPEWLHYYAALAYAKIGLPEKALDRLELAVRTGGTAVVKRARSDEALNHLKAIPCFDDIVKMPGKRRS